MSDETDEKIAHAFALGVIGGLVLGVALSKAALIDVSETPEPLPECPVGVITVQARDELARPHMNLQARIDF